MIGDDVGGIAVHIGARVAAAAGPSEVLVSSTVKDLVAGSGIAVPRTAASTRSRASPATGACTPSRPAAPRNRPSPIIRRPPARSRGPPMTDHEPARPASSAPVPSPHPLLDRVDWEAAGREAADLLSAYVRIDSSHPRGRTVETADFLEAILRREGLETRRYPTPDPDKVNLASWLRAERPGRQGDRPLQPHGRRPGRRLGLDVRPVLRRDRGRLRLRAGHAGHEGHGHHGADDDAAPEAPRRRADPRRAAAPHLRRGDRQPARREVDGREPLRRPRPRLRAGRGRLRHARLLQPGRRLRRLGRREADHLDEDDRPRRARPRLAAVGRTPRRTGWSAPPTGSWPQLPPRTTRPGPSPR